MRGAMVVNIQLKNLRFLHKQKYIFVLYAKFGKSDILVVDKS